MTQQKDHGFMDHPHRFQFGPFELNLTDERLWRGPDIIHLKPKSWSVLHCLVAHSGQLVSKNLLFETVWPDTAVSDAVLAVAIRDIRRALDDSARNPCYIETAHGRGYRFLAPVEIVTRDDTIQPTALSPSVEVDETHRYCPTCQHANPTRASFCNACAASLGTEPTRAAQDHTPTAVQAPLRAAERRQLTVLYCDLVESTPLSEHLDPEDFWEVMRHYQVTCGAVIESLEGQIVQYLGDGLLTYFGYPLAHEDNAHRAVRAGLGILTAIENLNLRLDTDYGVELAVRIGIHTGLVIVGGIEESNHQAQLALGMTMNIAARLQELAEPNTMIVSDGTYQLVQGYFEVNDLGRQPLKGVSNALQVFQIRGESQAQSRLETASPRGLTTFVGRDAELALVDERWTSVRSGQGQVMVISGEAGIGKSRLAQVVKDEIAGREAMVLECRTSPYAQHSALYPVTDLIQRWMHWLPEDSAEAKLQKLEDLLRPFRPDLTETVSLFAALLSLPVPPERYEPLALSPERQRQQVFELLVALILEQASQKPVLFILEDLHWIDPSTLELIELLMEQAPVSSLMLLLTCRPTFEPPWGWRSHLTPIALHSLSRLHVEQMVDHVTGGHVLPSLLVEQLIEKTDGVPLFIEEMTKAVLESAEARPVSEQEDAVSVSEVVTIPSTLQDSLMARLDRLGTAKGIAQVGSVIGRQFSYSLLQALVDLNEPDLQAKLRRLVEVELVYQTGLPPQSTYLFKHALIQDAAYHSLLKRRRQHVHERIVEVLQTRFAGTAESQPELLAHHYMEAGLAEEAIPYWLRAGQQASQRSAYAEAIAHFHKGLDTLSTLSDIEARAHLELQFQLVIGDALAVTRGYAAPEVRQAYARALVLCEQLPASTQLSDATMGLWRFYSVSAELQTAYRVSKQLLSQAEQLQNPLYLMQAHFMVGQPQLFMGDFVSARFHLEQSISYRPAQSTDNWANTMGIQVGCLTHLSVVLWHLGYAHQALIRAEEALDIAKELNHPFTIAFAQTIVAMLHQLRRELPVTQAKANTTVLISREQGFPFWLSGGMILEGWALAIQGQHETGLAQLLQGLDYYQQTGAQLLARYYIALLVESYWQSGQLGDALRTLEDALMIVDKTEERCWEAELHRLKGVLLLKTSIDHVAEAESCFQHALSLAQHQQAKSYELRTTTNLAELWYQQGKAEAARQLLANIYNKFTEGFDTADLQEAKALLETLSL